MGIFDKLFGKKAAEEVSESAEKVKIEQPMVNTSALNLSEDSQTPCLPAESDIAAINAYKEMCSAFVKTQNFRRAIDFSDLESISMCIKSCKQFKEKYHYLFNCGKLKELLVRNSIKQIYEIRFSDLNWTYHYTNEKTVIYDSVIKQLLETVDVREQLLVEAESKINNLTCAIDKLVYAEIKISDKPAPKGYVDDADSLPFSNVTKKTSRQRLGNFVAIDVETTGLHPSKSEIVEIAAVRFRDFKPIEVFHTLCSTKKGLSEEAKKINNISEDMLIGKPLFGCIANSLLEFIGKDNIVAHNLDFDLRFIVKHGVEVYNVERKYYCTLEIAQKTLKAAKDKWDKELDGWVTDFDRYFDVENYKLETLCKYYKIPLPKSHRALNDCLAAGYLLEALAKDRE